MKNAIIMIRVSSKEQEKKGYSLDKQEEICREYCKKKGYNILKVISGSTSGFKFERPDIEEMQKHLSETDVVVSTEMDRLSRDAVAYGMIKMLCLQNNVKIEFVYENDEEGSTIVADVKVAVAKDENIKRMERIRRGKQEKFKQGGHIAKPPFGYRFDKNVKPSLLVPDENFGKVQATFKLRAEGKTYKEIIETLSLYSNKKQRDYKEAAKIMGLKKILSNPVYLGYVKFQNNLSKGKHMPAVEEETFLNVNKCEMFEEFCSKRKYIIFYEKT